MCLIIQSLNGAWQYLDCFSSFDALLGTELAKKYFASQRFGSSGRATVNFFNAVCISGIISRERNVFIPALVDNVGRIFLRCHGLGKGTIGSLISGVSAVTTANFASGNGNGGAGVATSIGIVDFEEECAS